jgi:hypothetical protein
MASNTGAPWNLPYPEDTDLVRDGASDIEALADAVALGLDDLDTALQGAGGLVAVKSALFTGTQTNSTAGGANFAVTSLSITHTLAVATNKLIISAYLGVAGTSHGSGPVGIAVADNGTLISIGDAAGNRARVGAGGRVAGGTNTNIVTMPSVTFVYSPGNTSSHTYTVRAVNIETGTNTLYINRPEDNTDNLARPRGSSALVIQEVKV